MQYHLLVMAEYSSTLIQFACHTANVGDIYFDLAKTQQHFQLKLIRPR